MKKHSATKRAFRQYRSYNPKYFPLYFLKTIFKNISFYFNLWMTAEIINSLSRGQEKRELYFLSAAALTGILLIRSAAAVLDRQVETALEILENRQAEAFYRKTLGLDYDKIENPDIRQMRRKIDENQFINSYGVVNMRNTAEILMDCLVNLAFSAFLFGEMLSLMAAAPFSRTSLLAALTASVAGGFLFRLRGGQKTAAFWDNIGKHMLKENRLSRGFFPSGTDNRIYRQQLTIDSFFRKFNQEHRKIFMDTQHKIFCFVTVPGTVFFWLTTGFSYLIVCYYCALGAFPVGSIIKYVSYLGRLTECIQTLLDIPGRIWQNEKFLADYLAFFNIKNDMYQGSLAVQPGIVRFFFHALFNCLADTLAHFSSSRFCKCHNQHPVNVHRMPVIQHFAHNALDQYRCFPGTSRSRYQKGPVSPFHNLFLFFCPSYVHKPSHLSFCSDFPILHPLRIISKPFRHLNTHAITPYPVKHPHRCLLPFSESHLLPGQI